MELILDTADIDAVKELCGLLNVSGVTTNPSIIANSGKSFSEVVEGLIEVLDEDQTIFIQVVSEDFESMMEEARYISSLRPKNMYVKIPVTHEGLRAIKACKAEGIGVLATAIYSADEAFLAAMNGADYLAPYVNRMCNYTDGVKEAQDLIKMLAAQGLESKVIAASFKNTHQVHELILSGIQAVTIPPAVAFAMVDHPGTKIAVDEFTSVWNKAYGRTTLL